MSVRNLRLVVAATTLSLFIAGCSAESGQEAVQAPASSPNVSEVTYDSFDEILDSLEAEFGCSGDRYESTSTYMGNDYKYQYGVCSFKPIGGFAVIFFEDAVGFQYDRFEQCVATKTAGTSSIANKEIWGDRWVVLNVEGITDVSNNRLQKVVGGDIVTPYDGC